jgi:hypothetical protein
MATPQISGKYQFQVDLRGLRLPVTLTIPDIPATPPLEEEPIGPSQPSTTILDKGTRFVETRDSPVNVQQDTHAGSSDDPGNHNGTEDSDRLTRPLFVSNVNTVRVVFDSVVLVGPRH